MSTPAAHNNFLSRTNIPPMKVDMSNIMKLTGQDNYNVWASTMKTIWRAMKVSDIILDGARPASKADREEVAAFENLTGQVSMIFIQVVTTEILETIIELEDVHLVWLHLKTQYFRDNAFALVSQIMVLTTLPTTLDSTQSLSAFVQRFETEWLRLSSLAKASSDSYRQSFAKFLAEDKAKRDFLLGFIVNQYPNVVDNL